MLTTRCLPIGQTKTLFPTRLVTPDKSEFSIDLALPGEINEVCEFLSHHFFETSPNCYLIKINPINDIAFRQYISDCMREPVSLNVRDSTGRLVAIRINLLDNIFNKHKQMEQSSNNQNTRLIESLLTDLQKDIDLFTKYNTNKILRLAIMAVDKQYSGVGLGSLLVKMSIDLAKNYGAGAVAVTAVSQAAARVAAKNGLVTLRTIDYATYELDGVKPLANETNLLAEHQVAQFMARSIV